MQCRGRPPFNVIMSGERGYKIDRVSGRRTEALSKGSMEVASQPLGTSGRTVARHDDLGIEVRDHLQCFERPATEPITTKGVPPLKMRSPP
jgi:hypothetical protein